MQLAEAMARLERAAKVIGWPRVLQIIDDATREERTGSRATRRPRARVGTSGRGTYRQVVSEGIERLGIRHVLRIMREERAATARAAIKVGPRPSRTDRASPVRRAMAAAEGIGLDRAAELIARAVRRAPRGRRVARGRDARRPERRAA
jgi:hypothetical protein